MKIIAFAQLHDESRKGNLENWYRSLIGCDYIYIFDQGSEDNSHTHYERDPRTRVIYNTNNSFDRELICKAELLDLLLKDHPDVDWIFWLDGDTILDGRLLVNEGQGFRDLCDWGKAEGVEALSFGHYNLWRSDTYYRTDDNYHWLHDKGVCALWRNNGKLKFDRKSGLHHSMLPDGLGKPQRTDFSLIHRGFATDAQIYEKHRVYAGRGQKGYPLDRLLAEKFLKVLPIPREVLPTWYQIADDGRSPVGKAPLV